MASVGGLYYLYCVSKSYIVSNQILELYYGTDNTFLGYETFTFIRKSALNKLRTFLVAKG